MNDRSYFEPSIQDEIDALQAMICSIFGTIIGENCSKTVRIFWGLNSGCFFYKRII